VTATTIPDTDAPQSMPTIGTKQGQNDLLAFDDELKLGQLALLN